MKTLNLSFYVEKLTGEENKTTNIIASIGLIIISGLIITFIVLASLNGIKEF